MLMNFHIWTHPYNKHPDQETEHHQYIRSFILLSVTSSHPKDNHYSDL